MKKFMGIEIERWDDGIPSFNEIRVKAQHEKGLKTLNKTLRRASCISILANEGEWEEAARLHRVYKW